jgi:hypothetical protein
MGSEVESLKLAFSTNTRWAELATLAVFVGLLGDILVILIFDFFDKDKTWTEIVLAGLASLIIAFGVWGEYRFGQRATEAASRLQANAEKQVAALGIAAATLNKEAATLESENLKLRAKLGGFGTDIARENARIAELKVEAEVARKEIVLADARTNEANARIAESNERAEAERLARVRLEKSLAWRELDDAESKDIAVKLSPFAGEKLDVFAYREEPDAWMISLQIAAAVGGGLTAIDRSVPPDLVFTREHWWSEWKLDTKASGIVRSPGAKWDVKVFRVIEHDRLGTGMEVETSAQANSADIAAANALVSALKAADLEVSGPSTEGSERRRDVDLVSGSGEPVAPIQLTIQFRPPPHSRKEK